MEKVEEMLKIEEHHVISLEDITNVEWCPKFVKPEIRGHTTENGELFIVKTILMANYGRWK
ncbi:unnamed protein product [Porites evermanni]|uniref:Uncharacterized protein n=1 Tax=Porites evermanni TaxID=104178 RepID=A0ABN8S8G1_9CNID|nr:unnamed protein product [Porites evermanni]